MNWKHKCSLDWLRERQHYLTASDVKRLIPLTPSGRKRTVTDDDRYKVLADKLVELTEDDCISYGAMARGHILEPYAVQEFNDLLLDNGSPVRFHHWDDKLVADPVREIAFSPDATDIPMGFDPHFMNMIAEIKSYTPERHLATARMPKDRIEERWQIATAMALLDSIEVAYLLLYNPSLTALKMIVISYSRYELADEIKAVLEVEKEWQKFLATKPGDIRRFADLGRVVKDVGYEESWIIQQEQERRRLNPIV